MKKIVYYLLLACLISSPNIYARSKVQGYEIDIVPPIPSYEEIEHNPINPIETELLPPPYTSNKGKCCSSIERRDCCLRKYKNNTIENQHAYIGIATAVLLLMATLGMIFVARDSH